MFNDGFMISLVPFLSFLGDSYNMDVNARDWREAGLTGPFSNCFVKIEMRLGFRAATLRP